MMIVILLIIINSNNNTNNNTTTNIILHPFPFNFTNKIIINISFFSIQGSCDFESGLCDMKHSNDANFKWTIWSGTTPTEHTGPTFDHSLLTSAGQE